MRVEGIFMPWKKLVGIMLPFAGGTAFATIIPQMPDAMNAGYLASICIGTAYFLFSK